MGAPTARYPVAMKFFDEIRLTRGQSGDVTEFRIREISNGHPA